MKKTILLSALAFGALTSSAALAEPVALSDAQLDTVTAGQAASVVVEQTARIEASAAGPGATAAAAAAVAALATTIVPENGENGED